jgi:hypothetical protein
MLFAFPTKKATLLRVWLCVYLKDLQLLAERCRSRCYGPMLESTAYQSPSQGWFYGEIVEVVAAL